MSEQNAAGEPRSDHDLLVAIHTLLRETVLPQVSDHERRLRRLERAMWLITGAAVAVGSAVGTAVGNGILRGLGGV